MGVSSDAILFYGFSAEDEGTWEELEDTDWEEEFARRKGINPPAVAYSDATQAEWREYWDKSRKARADEPCEIDRHCSDGHPIPYVCIRGTHVTANRGSPQAVTPEFLTVDPRWNDQLKSFCDLMGIPWEEPKWYIASWMG
jgi:hypothetical protein